MSRSNTQNNSQLRTQLQSLKAEVASSMNVNLSDGGNLTSREAGSVGGEMVKRMIAYAQQHMNSDGGNMMR